jgi:hypothetical protein
VKARILRALNTLLTAAPIFALWHSLTASDLSSAEQITAFLLGFAAAEVHNSLQGQRSSAEQRLWLAGSAAYNRLSRHRSNLVNNWPLAMRRIKPQRITQSLLAASIQPGGESLCRCLLLAVDFGAQVGRDGPPLASTAPARRLLPDAPGITQSWSRSSRRECLSTDLPALRATPLRRYLPRSAHRGEYLQVAVVDIPTSYYRKSAVPLTRSCGFLYPAFVSSRGPLRYQHGVGVGPMLRPVD